MSITPELRRELMTLPADERQKLADELYESLIEEQVDPEWQRAWTSEIEQRIGDVSAKRVDLIDADDVHGDMQAELRDARR
jgi:hypothetical protein